jgi:hypothetical protein
MSEPKEVIAEISELRPDGVQCYIKLPESAIQILKSGKAVLESVTFLPIKESVFRKETISKQTKSRGKYVEILRATVDERKVIRAWNRSKYIKQQESAQERDPRNYPVAFRRIPDVLPLVKKALKTVGFVETVRNIETYFSFCSTGQHIWEGQSHGYKSLKGFLEKLLLLNKTGEKGWWDVRDLPIQLVDDEHTRLTIRVANSFSQTFMGEEKFVMEVGDKNYISFMKAAQHIIRYINRKKRQGIELSQTEVIKNLLEFLESLFDKESERVFPGHLCSESVWASFPSFLIEKGVV